MYNVHACVDWYWTTCLDSGPSILRQLLHQSRVSVSFHQIDIMNFDYIIVVQEMCPTLCPLIWGSVGRWHCICMSNMPLSPPPRYTCMQYYNILSHKSMAISMWFTCMVCMYHTIMCLCGIIHKSHNDIKINTTAVMSRGSHIRSSLALETMNKNTTQDIHKCCLQQKWSTTQDLHVTVIFI